MSKFTQKTLAFIALISITTSGFGTTFSVAFAEEVTEPAAEVVVPPAEETPASDEVVEPVTEETEEVTEPAAEVVVPPAEETPASDEVVEPVTEETEEVIPPTDGSTEEVIPPAEETPASDEMVEPEANSFRQFSASSVIVETPVCELGENLLNNGSFEADVVVAHDGDWEIFPIVTDWLISLSDGLELWRDGFYGGASNGFQNAELDANSSTKITQTVATQVGATYELRFDFSARPDRDSSAQNSVDVYVGNVLLMNVTADGSDIAANTWSNHTKTFVATESTTDISFADIGISDSYGSLIDNAVLCLVQEAAPQCVPELEGDWADNVEILTQMKRKDGSDVLANRSVEESALNNTAVVGSAGFVSLGFGGSIVVSFDNYVPNVVGTDITIYETTNLPYPTETALVEVSQNGSQWFTVGSAVNAGGNYFDFDSTGLMWIKFVRVTDTSDSELFPNDADGFDVNAVLAAQTVCDEPKAPTYTIGGFKWNDLDADGYWDENEPKLAGWTIVATENEDTSTPAQYEDVTDEDGYYSIEVPAGSWIVSEVNQKGWEQTAPADPEYCSYTFGELLEAKVVYDEVGCNFGNHQTETQVPQCVADLNLIQNGSFETPDLPEDGFGWDIFDSTINGLSWVVEWLNLVEGSPVPAKLELQSGFYAASNGVQYAELDSNWNAAPGGPYFGEDTRVRVYQELETIPGATYTVSYDFSALPRHNAATNVLSALLDGVEVKSHTADGTELTNTSWNTYSYSFVATTTNTTIGFADAGIADSFGTLLDNVTVNCVPAVVEEEIPTSSSSHGGGKRAVPRVAGDSISTPEPTPLVLGEQVSVMPYGAPGTGHGGTSSQVNVLTLSQLLVSPRGLRITK